MNNNLNDLDGHRTFQLMNELEDGATVSQRELAGRLGVAVGLVNSYLKNFVAKGYVRVKNYPRNRYAYLLTPKGFAEKSRLAYQHLSYFNDLYRVARNDYRLLFQRLQKENVKEVAFCGVDEIAEIAFLSLKETGVELKVVMDEEGVDGELFGYRVIDLSAGAKEVFPIVFKTRGLFADKSIGDGSPPGADLQCSTTGLIS